MSAYIEPTSTRRHGKGEKTRIIKQWACRQGVVKHTSYRCYEMPKNARVIHVVEYTRTGQETKKEDFHNSNDTTGFISQKIEEFGGKVTG